MKIYFTENILSFQGELTLHYVSSSLKQVRNIIRHAQYDQIIVDLADVSRIDSSGVALLDHVNELAKEQQKSIRIANASGSVRESLQTFSSLQLPPEEVPPHISLVENLGKNAFRIWQEFVNALYLISDSFYFAIVNLISRKGTRKGEFINQCIIIGMNAFFIIALISFLIGFILALQSAAQMRQFGASIYVADLVAISMTREMGPLITAILFAGRSGSSIASEIATMVVTEETDALRAMGLNPVRYTLVPKVHAITVMMPLLTVLSMVIGIIGSFVIGYGYLGIGLQAFYSQAVNALILKDILTGLVKSVVFAWIIVLVGAFYGFRVKGGATDVGRATTSSVVAAIFMVILADSILGLLFYFKW